MATQASILAWKILSTKEPAGLQFMESQRVGHNGSDLTHTHAHPPFADDTEADRG